MPGAPRNRLKTFFGETLVHPENLSFSKNQSSHILYLMKIKKSRNPKSGPAFSGLKQADAEFF